MHTVVKCVCCGEIPQTLSRRRVDGVEVGCIRLHPGFLSVCLNLWILQTVYYSYQDCYAKNTAEGAINE